MAVVLIDNNYKDKTSTDNGSAHSTDNHLPLSVIETF